MNITTRELITYKMGYYYLMPHFLHLLLHNVILVFAVGTGMLLSNYLKSIPEEHLSIKVLQVQGHISEIISNDYPKEMLSKL